MAGKMTEQEAAAKLEKSSKKVTDKDIERVLEKEQDIEEKVQKNGSLRQYFNVVKSMYSLVKAYWKGEYREIPWFTIAAIVTALLYVFNPLDVLPDVIPFLGLTDDALILAVCLKLVQQDLDDFERWRSEKEQASQSDH
ncbi:YkvA family protein [Photobacterium sp. 1_MG-2023]|uniref:YkvA family protein n=1 Tax=Photobacterium sp. 1_MG-2023 TaxID=3062646 RepID=UPI0026E21C38|nr:YkvA family protein [Photobacterium sp. 1_MG-2023]MDO6706963.1 YkvA family protein [Photobacterium sp. 1_MG-2023]